MIMQDILKWYAHGKVGLSSKTMAAFFSGQIGEINHPHDPDDFNRCLLFFEMVPAAKVLLSSLGSLSPEWYKLVSNWSEIERCFLDEVGLNWSKGGPAVKTYDLMRSILDSNVRQQEEEIEESEIGNNKE